jgi:hypothetical protein
MEVTATKRSITNDIETQLKEAWEEISNYGTSAVISVELSVDDWLELLDNLGSIVELPDYDGEE